MGPKKTASKRINWKYLNASPALTVVGDSHTKHIYQYFDPTLSYLGPRHVDADSRVPTSEKEDPPRSWRCRLPRAALRPPRSRAFPPDAHLKPGGVMTLGAACCPRAKAARDQSTTSHAPRLAVPPTTMAANFELLVRENCFLFSAPDGDVSIDAFIDAIELTAGKDSVLVLQHMGGSMFLVCTRNANQATRLMVAEGFRVNNERVAVEAVGPPLPYIPDEILNNDLSQYGTVKSVTFATVASRQNKLNGVRVVKMEMCRPVPNFTTIAGHRVMCEYRGMRRVCVRCGDVGHMATACSTEYCKRCGTFGHDTVGCEAECKRCGGRHGTKECFRKRSYVAAAHGFPPSNSDQASRTAPPNAPASSSGLQVLKPRTHPPSPKKGPITGTTRGHGEGRFQRRNILARSSNRVTGKRGRSEHHRRNRPDGG
ncbi:hypothetical protein HPB52_009050 [Rhipicephalus sanguineus]|uniref:CCHC-type domain-containing protein n=1 Tax=Rhipicephalus sanguineus TaxID=34632 RepID=A0A9D4Q009_RHISA|nr:hypothetical protein HPB52_009050 [Rhipicephalus sanguineus]